MAEPGDTIDHDFLVQDAAGAGITGLVIGNFTLTARHKPYGGALAAWTHGATLAEIGLGWYRLTFTLPATAGYWSLRPTHATYYINVAGWEDELEITDLAGIKAAVTRPIVRVTASGTLGQPAALEPIYAYRRAVMSFTIEDGSGNPIDLTTYTNWTVGFRSATSQTASPPKLDAVHGTPTGFGLVADSSGLLTITIPENCTIFQAITEGAAPVDEVVIRMEVTADSPSTETNAIIASSPLTIRRREVGTT